MGVTIHVRDVDPETKQRLEASAAAAGKSLSAFLREKLDEIAAKPKRELGWLAHLGPVGDPLDGWGPMSEEDLALWEGSESFDPDRD